MLSETIKEAQRQLEICNACRYCEGYCSVFPAVHRRRSLDSDTITHLANLCHNCRGCYYACQYTEPHEFKLNIPAVLAGVRQETWQQYTWPDGLSRAFHRSGAAITLATIVGFILLLAIVNQLGSWQGEGFYGVLSHNVMLALFAPAFLLSIVLTGVSIVRYWKATAPVRIKAGATASAFTSVITLNNLSGGHGDGCNFEDEDRFSNSRKWLHQATLFGFLLCFASTGTATVLHYAFNSPAPYSWFSLPKLFGVSGGLLLCIGTLGLAYLKLKADKKLGASAVWGGEMGFVLLLFFVSASGLALYWLGNTSLLPSLLVIHLGAVLAFFLLMPYTKMIHGFFRIAALIRESNEKRVRS